MKLSCFWLTLAVTALFSSAGASADPAGSLRPEVRRLLPLEFWSTDPLDHIVIGGSAIGGAGQPSPFYTAAVEALGNGGATEREFLEMTRHVNFAVRIVGMAGLARKGSSFGIDRLKQLLTSREGEDGYPVGCPPRHIYESAVAWKFLTETGYLCCRRTTPLLPEKEAIALALEVLARDECAGAREPEWYHETGPVPSFLADKITSGKLVLNLPALRAAAPGMESNRLIKAAGRLPAQLCTPLLIEMLHAPEHLPAYNKLAAASALARQILRTDGDYERAALRTAAKSINDPLNHLFWGDRFASLYSPDWLRLPTRWPEQKPDGVTDSDYHEFFLPIWTAWALDLPPRGDDRPICTSWETLSAGLKDSKWTNTALAGQKWSAFGDTLFRLELKARFLGLYEDREIKPEPARLALLTTLKPLLSSPFPGGHLADNAELTWRIHENILSTPAPTDAAQMKPYTGKVPRAGNAAFAMVPIPGGEFLMGSPDKEKDRKPDEGPQVKVKMDPFWMGAHEVTWDTAMAFIMDITDNHSEERKSGPRSLTEDFIDATTGPSEIYYNLTHGMGIEGHPVVSVTQHFALQYCQWLSAQTGHFYRLPSEAEWEYAARAGSVTAYFWGDDPDQIGDYAWFFDNSDGKTAKVGQKKPNPWGLYDICGNVAEWTLDPYDSGWYAALTTPESRIDPFHAPATLHPRTVRGGSYDDDPHQCRPAARQGSTEKWQLLDPYTHKNLWYLTNAPFIGFRIVRPLKVPAPQEMHRIWNPGMAAGDKPAAK